VHLKARSCTDVSIFSDGSERITLRWCSSLNRIPPAGPHGVSAHHASSDFKTIKALTLGKE
jgi:hypothetical protein